VRVVVLTVDAPNQAALCRKLEPHCELVGLVLSRNVTARRFSQRLRMFRNRIEGRFARSPFVTVWHHLQRFYQERFGGFPNVPTIRVRNVNDAQTLRWLQDTDPDLVLVSGTNLVRRPLLDWSSRRLGMINLHTGISPYVKGGPDCTNWCLAERTFHLIGSTILWLDAGVDSGPILATEQTPLTGTETVDELHRKVMDHAHDLCVRAIQAISSGRSIPRIAQDAVAAGRTFSSRGWNRLAIRRAWTNFTTAYDPSYFQSRTYRTLSAQLKLYPLMAQDTERTMDGTLAGRS